MGPFLARIDIYPIKSLDGMTRPQGKLLTTGALQNDRTFVLVDAAGNVINGKRDAHIHPVRSRFADDLSQVALWTEERDPATFSLTGDRLELAAWFSAYFQQPVTIQQNLEMGFPDDTTSPGPTIVSTATLQTVADWFGLTVDETRRRFRSNLEVDGVPAFWEDQLFSETEDPVPFQVGAVTFLGINPCQRCIVPTRDPQTGDGLSGFQKQFSQQRSATLPPGVARSRFKHFYYLTVNTRTLPTEGGKGVQVGDRVSLL
jgi:uncharacterized protein YcbX